MPPLRTLRQPFYLLALLPLLVPAVAWWREAMWFKSSGFEVGLQVALFFLLLAIAIYPASLLVLSAVRSRVKLLVLALFLAGAVLFIAREAVIAFVSWGYSQEHSAYTSAAVAASKRGLLLVLCSAVVPVLVAVLLLFRRAYGAGISPSASEASNESAA